MLLYRTTQHSLLVPNRPVSAQSTLVAWFDRENGCKTYYLLGYGSVQVALRISRYTIGEQPLSILPDWKQNS